MDERERERIRQRNIRKRKVRRIKRVIRVAIVFSGVFLLILIISFAGSRIDKIFTEKQQEEPIVEQEEQFAEQEEELPKEEVYEEPEIDIIMVGDILLHEAVQESGMLEDGTYNYDHLFTNIKEDVQEAELALVNQEVILGGAELGLTGYPAFNAAYEIGDALVNAGFNTILHATNHALDKNKTGLLNCISFWENNYPDITYLGIYDSQEDYDNSIYIYEQDGVEIAVLNYTYGTNGIPMPEDMPFAVNMLEEEKVIADIHKAEEIADFTIVCPHWGTEYQYVQDENQNYWANIFLENGVDLVLGTHPHVIEPVELLTDDEGNEMLVYWSLGNFVNATARTGELASAQMVGGMAEVTLGVGEDGGVYIKEYGIEPLVTHLDYSTQGITTYKLEDYTEELALKNMTIEKDPAFSLGFCQNLCKEVFGDLYKGE